MKRIIVVDDDPGIQDILELILCRAGYEVTVLSGPDPLFNGSFEKPDLFILDKQLSGTDGLDVCRFLKKQESTSRIPVIIFSANMRMTQSAHEAGASDFVEKPFHIQDLLEVVKRNIVHPGNAVP